jgi:hypothetical protein
MAATIVVGGSIATTTTGQSAFAFQKKGDKGNGNGNTITVQKCKQAAAQSGFDNIQRQECENLICTHPGERRNSIHSCHMSSNYYMLKEP